MTWGSGRPALTTEMVSGPGAPAQQRWGGEVSVFRRHWMRCCLLCFLAQHSKGHPRTRKRAAVGSWLTILEDLTNTGAKRGRVEARGQMCSAECQTGPGCLSN